MKRLVRIRKYFLVLELSTEIFNVVSGSDIFNNPACSKFYTYWKAQNYPGFPSEGKNRTRSYVPHLIDAVQTYFLIVDNLIKAKMSVTKDNVFQALNGSGPAAVSFQGCTGTVSFDPATGSRSVAAQVPDYDLVSLSPAYWEVTNPNHNSIPRCGHFFLCIGPTFKLYLFGETREFSLQITSLLEMLISEGYFVCSPRVR